MAAATSVFFMHKYGYAPRSIISVGVGHASERMIWDWLLPDADLLGIDPRGRKHGWTARYLQAAVVAPGSPQEVPYCGTCQSIMCPSAKIHSRPFSVRAVTLDEAASGMQPPFFLWLDCEGAELNALRGGAEVLKHTRWINAEVRERAWTNTYTIEFEALARSLGFRLHYVHPDSVDRLYRKR